MKKAISTLILNKQDAAAAAPALLMYLVTFIMLILDTAIPEMIDSQYLVYPVLVRIAGLLSIPCALICFLMQIRAGRLKTDPAKLFFMLFAVCIVVSTLINGITKASLFGTQYRYVGVYDMFLCMAVYMYCPGRISTTKGRNLILSAYVALADIVAVVFIFDIFTETVNAFRDRLEPGSVFFHGNHYGYFLVVAVTVSAGYYLFEKGRLMIFGAASMAINLAALALNRTMGALIALVFTLIVMIVFVLIRNGISSIKPWILAGSFVAAGIAALVLSDQLREDAVIIIEELLEILSGTNDIYAGNGRWGIWQVTIGFIADRPLFGYGCEGISGMLYDIALTASPHNELLTYAAYYGIPAAIFYALGVIFTIAGPVREKDAETERIIAAFAALGYFTSSFFGVVMFYTVPFMFIMLGLCRIIGDETEL